MVVSGGENHTQLQNRTRPHFPPFKKQRDKVLHLYVWIRKNVQCRSSLYPSIFYFFGCVCGEGGAPFTHDPDAPHLDRYVDGYLHILMQKPESQFCSIRFHGV